MELKEELAGLPAIAWSLRAPGANGTWKEYRLFVIDKYVIVGWGTMGRTMQYMIEVAQTPAWARAWAAEQTAIKERKGYEVYIMPRTKNALSGTRDWIEGLVGQRGSNAALDRQTSLLLERGEPLG